MSFIGVCPFWSNCWSERSVHRTTSCPEPNNPAATVLPVSPDPYHIGAPPRQRRSHSDHIMTDPAPATKGLVLHSHARYYDFVAHLLTLGHGGNLHERLADLAELAPGETV